MSYRVTASIIAVWRTRVPRGFRGCSRAGCRSRRPAGRRRSSAATAWHRADGAAAMRGLLTTGVRPDAVFCFNDTLALSALRALHGAGLRAPEDVAVVGFDDIEDGRFSVPTLSTVAPDKEQIARANRPESPRRSIPRGAGQRTRARVSMIDVAEQ
ncbi:substrate-binding domain-containing protein, partial [Micromonospora sp. DT4]|uniref:substrate-binding domain-containing protein n=1 Tax=Micromonospora sp. DT4 TaxID=3393438 RepID=UPI003CEE1503